MKTSLISLVSIVFMASLVSADCPQGDLDRDCKVNLFDFALMAESWLEVEPNLPFGTVVINEVMAHSSDVNGADLPDWIELYNTTGSAVNIGGWYLSDSDSPLIKYKIPNGTTIPAYGYIVFYEDTHFGIDHGNNTPFGLSENGEAVYLSFPDVTSNPKHVSDDKRFEASERGVSFGLYTTSLGDVKFVAMDSNTPGQLNAYPKVGPIVISEVMYDSFVHTDAEYIELYNIENYPVTLQETYDGNNIPWKLIESPDNPYYTFPLGTTIPANGYLIVAKTSSPSQFRTWYPDTPTGVSIFGAFAGRLSNDGENVEISMPGELDIENPSIRYYIRIDNVRYSDGSQHKEFPGLDPWPKGPDNDGESLQRIDPTAYGDDVNNWLAGEATPGY